MINSTKLNILCVEDDLVVADYISSLLDKNKYRVKTINDGKKALDFLLSTGEPPDLILLDYILPSLNGLQILESLNTYKKNYAIVFLTVDETLETAVKAMKAGAIDYLTKSKFLKAELNIKIENAHQIFQDRVKKDFYEAQLSILKLAIEQSPNSFIITNKNGDVEYVNRKFSENTGYHQREVLGRNLRILKTDYYGPEYFKNLWLTISSGRTWKGEFVNKKKNGEIFYEKGTITPIRNKSGEIVSYLGIKQDITELKQIESALNKKNEEIDGFFIVGLDLLCITENITGKFIRLNKAWEDTLGYPIEELIGKACIDLVHPDDIEITLKTSTTLKEKGRVSNFVNRYRCKNGTYKFIEWSCINNQDGTSSSSARDITKRKLSEFALKESESRFRSIFEMSNAGIFFSDKNGQIILINQAFENIVEYKSHELYQMDFNQFTHLDDLAAENDILKQLIYKKIERYRIEKRYMNKSGKIIWVDLAVSVIRDDVGDPLNYVGVVNDISNRKLYENQLKNINETKDKFFSIISHDLRNQFSGIQGLSEILINKGNEFSETRRNELLTLLHHGGKSALALLENLLEWSRSQLDRVEINTKLINLHVLVENVCHVIDNQAILKQIIIQNDVDNAQMIWADENMINTVLRNLLNNAIKFTLSGGKVTISSRNENNMDFITIHDTGIGMSSKRISNLFKIEKIHSTFGTNQERGTGLGLILCKEFINKHGGEIVVTSEIEKGSEFIISLPAKVLLD